MTTLFIVFGGICLTVLAAAGLAWVLNLFGMIKLEPDQKTILDRAFGVGLVGGLATAGAALFTPSKDPKEESAGKASDMEASVAASPATGTPSAPAPIASPSAPPPAPVSCRPAAHPAFLAEWANAALDTPPTFRCAIAATYPACVAELRERPLTDIAPEAAMRCGADLLAFRRIHITPAYAAKLGYQDNLEAAEASLRNPRNPEETGRRSYVITELGRMNGPLWNDFVALDRRSRSDMLACQSSNQRCIIEP